MTPERYDDSGQSGCLLRYLHEGPLARAFGVLDPGGRTRTGTTRMDSPVLYQLSYPGVVTELYGESSTATRCPISTRFSVTCLSASGVPPAPERGYVPLTIATSVGRRIA